MIYEVYTLGNLIISLDHDNDFTGLIHRTDFFPGLGWMLLKKLWLELEPIWPEGWDNFGHLASDDLCSIWKWQCVFSNVTCEPMLLFDCSISLRYAWHWLRQWKRYVDVSVIKSSLYVWIVGRWVMLFYLYCLVNWLNCYFIILSNIFIFYKTQHPSFFLLALNLKDLKERLMSKHFFAFL